MRLWTHPSRCIASPASGSGPPATRATRSRSTFRRRCAPRKPRSMAPRRRSYCANPCATDSSRTSGNELLLVVPAAAARAGLRARNRDSPRRQRGSRCRPSGLLRHFARNLVSGPRHPVRTLMMSPVVIRKPSTWSAPGLSLRTGPKGMSASRGAFPTGAWTCWRSTSGGTTRRLVEHGGMQIEVNANREVEDALRARPPDPAPARHHLRQPVAAARPAWSRRSQRRQARTSPRPSRSIDP